MDGLVEKYIDTWFLSTQMQVQWCGTNSCNYYCLHIDQQPRSQVMKAHSFFSMSMTQGYQLVLNSTEYLLDMDDCRTELMMSMTKAKKIAMENICWADRKQKEFYDWHSGDAKYKVGEGVMVYMPRDVSDKKWKIARPYHRIWMVN